ncbi:hypothetical protein PR001_g20025 [Phytophthora rubi]|uniref:Secreted protein n=1 Tax=Phytophthora rubi TaxID=129364 RepID=A0A6A3JTP8_9STRA|nr:hypothetical protein PR002_g20188 [Phytophthora rubi]KAE8995825.1 hypothetical protein PR001_g20025 [Phytophthora rubi]
MILRIFLYHLQWFHIYACSHTIDQEEHLVRLLRSRIICIVPTTGAIPAAVSDVTDRRPRKKRAEKGREQTSDPIKSEGGPPRTDYFGNLRLVTD